LELSGASLREVQGHSQNCLPLIITAISSTCHCEVGRERLPGGSPILLEQDSSSLCT
jgi:hypothetical protein